MQQPWKRNALLAIAWLVMAGLAAAILIARAADFVWVFELPGHFRAQIGGMAILLTGVFFALRAWRHAAAAFVIATFIALPIVSF